MEDEERDLKNDRFKITSVSTAGVRKSGLDHYRLFGEFFKRYE